MKDRLRKEVTSQLTDTIPIRIVDELLDYIESLEKRIKNLEQFLNIE